MIRLQLDTPHKLPALLATVSMVLAGCGSSDREISRSSGSDMQVQAMDAPFDGGGEIIVSWIEPMDAIDGLQVLFDGFDQSIVDGNMQDIIPLSPTFELEYDVASYQVWRSMTPDEVAMDNKQRRIAAASSAYDTAYENAYAELIQEGVAPLEAGNQASMEAREAADDAIASFKPRTPEPDGFHYTFVTAVPIDRALVMEAFGRGMRTVYGTNLAAQPTGTDQQQEKESITNAVKESTKAGVDAAREVFGTHVNKLRVDKLHDADVKAAEAADSAWTAAFNKAIDDGRTHQEAVEVADTASNAAFKSTMELYSYRFRVVALSDSGDQVFKSEPTTSIVATDSFFNGAQLPLLVIMLVLCGAVLYFIVMARKGRALKVRTIAGLKAVDEAVGRATEMGRSVLFVPGIQDINDIQTIAGITVLSRVSKTAAEYDAKVEVPTARSLVMTAARETVQASYLSAGRPDSYNPDLIYYVTDEQFGYVAYLSGMMVREKPAACFYMGCFFAESLILAETGNSIGAIQIAGTAMPAQLPFFVAACDYTLIGEEFFAASAYLSGEADQLGSLKGQDVGKILVGIILLVGCILATIYSVTDSVAVGEIVEYIKNTILS